MTIQSINPATGAVIKEYTLLENRDIKPVIKATHKVHRGSVVTLTVVP